MPWYTILLVLPAFIPRMLMHIEQNCVKSIYESIQTLHMILKNAKLDNRMFTTCTMSESVSTLGHAVETIATVD